MRLYVNEEKIFIIFLLKENIQSLQSSTISISEKSNRQITWLRNHPIVTLSLRGKKKEEKKKKNRVKEIYFFSYIFYTKIYTICTFQHNIQVYITYYTDRRQFIYTLFESFYSGNCLVINFLCFFTRHAYFLDNASGCQVWFRQKSTLCVGYKDVCKSFCRSTQLLLLELLLKDLYVICSLM